MSKINDRWSALSMKDRAALIDIYVKSGITDLGEIRKNYNSFDEGGDIESIVYEEGIEEDVPNYNNVYTLSRDTGDYMKNWYSQRQNIGLNSFYNKVVDEYNTKYENDLIIPKIKAPVGTNNEVGEYVVAPGSNGIVTKNPFYYEKDLEVAKDYLKDFNRRSGNFKIRFDNTSRYAGRYDPNEGNLIHISTKVPNDARLNYAVHEATHSLTNRDFNFDSDYLGHLPEDNTYYFGNPSEQYARVMQLRNYLNLDPNKVYTEDEVNKIREDIEFKYPNTREHLGDNLLFIYSNKEIADMLNNSFGDGGDTSWEKVDRFVEKAEPWVSGTSLAATGTALAVSAASGGTAAPVALPIAATIGTISNSAGVLIDGYQAVRDFQKGDYKSGTWNGVEALFGVAGAKLASKLAHTRSGRAIGKAREQLVRERFNSSGDKIARLMRKGLTYEQAAEKAMQNAVNYVDNSSKVKDTAKGIKNHYDEKFKKGANIVDTVFDTVDVGEGIYSGFKEEHPIEIYKIGGKLNKFETGDPTGEGTATYNHPRYNHKEEAAIYSYLRERGVPHTQASAIMGNIAVESMLDPHISQIGGGGGYGLIQATDQPRKNNFINYDGQPYEFGSELEPETQRQLDYIIDKGLNNYTIGEWRKVGKYGARNVRKEFLKESDIIKASDLFTKGYLRPGKPHTKRRQSMSTFYNEKYTNPFENEYNSAFLFK